MQDSVSQQKKPGKNLGEAGDILDIVLKKGWLIRPQIEQMRQDSLVSQKSVTQILEESGLISQEKLIQAYSDFFKLPIIRLRELYVPRQIISKIPEKLAKKYFILVFDQKADRLKMAIAKPARLQYDRPGVLADIQKKQKVDIDLYITSEGDFNEALKYYHLKPKIKIDQTTKLTELPDKSKNESQPEEKLPKILDILVSQRLINQKEALEIIKKGEKQNVPFENIIREEGYVSDDELAKAQAQQFNLPYLSLKNLKISAENIRKFPIEISEKYRLVVFETLSDKVFKIATAYPENPAAHEVVSFLKSKYGITGYLHITTPQDITLVLEKYKESEPEKKGEHKTFSLFGEGNEPWRPQAKEPKPIGELDIGTLIKKDIQTKEELEKITKTGDIPRTVAGLINFALVKKSSDIHKMDRKIHPGIIARIKISSRLRLDEQRIPQDGRFAISFKNRAVDIRVSTLPTSNGEKAVLRLLEKTKKIISFEELGLTGRAFDVLANNIKKPYGMILATGPTGSGKTTTLYAVLQSINTSQTNIVTLEDPIEYQIDGVNHCQARPDIGFSFAEGLRSILRQDPNVIMVGEIRDKETAGMAVQAALTGHLVLSSIHTNNAIGVIPRLLEMEVDPFLIAPTLIIAVAQRLVRTLCPATGKPIEIEESMRKMIE